MTDPTPVRVHVTSGHNARTSSTGATLRLRTNVDGAPFSRSDCWREDCREAYAPYMTVKVYLALRESTPIYVSAVCHDEFARYPELRHEARAWLDGSGEGA